MEIVSKKTRAKDIYKRWIKQYPLKYHKKGKWAQIGARLKNEKPKTEEEVNAIIGNESWMRVHCYQCDEPKDIVVRVGEKPDYESSTSWICKDCLIIALKMIEDHEKLV